VARRKKRIEEHQNHERWLVSYADFITLLFAFFVVMYSVSSVNQGKYKVLSNTLDGAFKGEARTMQAIDIGDILQNKALIDKLMMDHSGDRLIPDLFQDAQTTQTAELVDSQLDGEQKIAESAVLSQLADKLQDALSPMIDRDLVSIEKNDLWVEIELNSNMLFGSGNATLSDEALQVLWKVAKPIRKLNNAIQVEGFTDNIPINTFEYPSNWELSAARAASVVHLFTKYGVDPDRLAAVGYGQYHPIEDNETAEGRERNRRVVIVVQSNAISRFTEKKKTADNLDDGQRMVETTVNELSEAIDDPVSRVDSVTESREDLEKQRKLERARSSRFNKFLNQ
tara:strand:- start:965 stop:1984 length:1020 start_codon:yes stop_codon:yes gene_type:complete